MKWYLEFCECIWKGGGGQPGETLCDLWYDICSLVKVKVGRGEGGRRIRTKMTSPHPAAAAAAMKRGVFSSFLESQIGTSTELQSLERAPCSANCLKPTRKFTKTLFCAGDPLKQWPWWDSGQARSALIQLQDWKGHYSQKCPRSLGA